MIFRSIVNAPLIDTGLFEEKKTMAYPDFILCFSYKNSTDYKIDHNYKLTANYLNESAINFTIESVFEKFIYINEKDEIINLKPNSSGINNPYFELNIFLLNKDKCFEFLININHERFQFHFRRDAFPLKIFLRREKLKNMRSYFKNIKRYILQKNYGILLDLDEYTIPIRKYQVKTEVLEIKKFDQFRMLKNPSSLLSNVSRNVFDHIQNIINEFNFKI